jgi:uncharacterized protein YhaN
MLAKTCIESASLSMSGNVTPKLSQKAGELMSRVSRGAHPSVQTTKELELSVDQDGFLVSADRLSGGTRDAAYICLRIAVMLRIFEDELPPLMLDEALCQLDDERACGVISVLSELSNEAQCLLFTCHTRETALCDKLGIMYSKQEL